MRLASSRQGHYLVNGQIDGQDVTFLLDTGATQVAVPSAVAERLGLARGAPIVISTANGRATGHRTRLASLRLGDIELRDVAALIASEIPAAAAGTEQRGDEVVFWVAASDVASALADTRDAVARWAAGGAAVDPARVRVEQERYDKLRFQVAELESPERVVAAAQERLGMIEPDHVNYVAPVASNAPAPDATDGTTTPDSTTVKQKLAAK